MATPEKQMTESELHQHRAMMPHQPTLDLLALIEDATIHGHTPGNDARCRIMQEEAAARASASKWLDLDFIWHSGAHPYTPEQVTARRLELLTPYSQRKQAR
jgi:hypothetical protein